jgi:hypothetical protein
MKSRSALFFGKLPRAGQQRTKPQRVLLPRAGYNEHLHESAIAPMFSR